jgi:phosphoribosyl 1,2-cyclic phosphate phosphodiesterase
MKLEVLGSGGSVITPKPFCSCLSCREARKKGIHYSRLGPSVYIHGPNILIDTPEEISIQLNRSTISNIQVCLYSHWHPDHTAGKRIFEMNMDWLGVPPKNKSTKVIITEKIAETFNTCMAIGQQFDFLINEGLVDLQVIKNDQEITIGKYFIKPIQLKNDYVFGYLIKDDEKKLLIIMDELKGWVPNKELSNIEYDLVYLPFGIFDINPLNNKRLQ